MVGFSPKIGISNDQTKAFIQKDYHSIQVSDLQSLSLLTAFTDEDDIVPCVSIHGTGSSIKLLE